MAILSRYLKALNKKYGNNPEKISAKIADHYFNGFSYLSLQMTTLY